ncbi:unnamed protein product [Linum tenue]|uniref:F-box domain-containing protein n=1 Tax=Linum tenue TaxID=586396 RepID=A0AAV0NJ36_9ROSI|nr:unnamed protein product [Linum tenue]
MTTRLRESTADRISNLPDGAIERILVFLPIKDAAKTSLLSRYWRHRWRSIPELVFDYRFAPLPEEDDRKVVMKIYEALLAHDGLLTKFELSISKYRRNLPLDLLMLHLSRKGVQELTLTLLVEGENYPNLHSSLFSAAFPLKRLKLQGCEFKVSSGFAGFSKLTFLQLEDVGLPDGFFENFIPKFPLLEELRVTECGDTEPVFVSHSLKVLFLHSSFLNICFKDTPVLSVLSVLDTDLFCGEGEPSEDDYLDMVPFFASLPAIQQLNLGIELLLLLAAGCVPYRLPTDLHHLEVLAVPRLLLDRLPQAQILVCLIMSSPNLQTLTIQIDDDRHHPPSDVVASLQQLLEADDQPGVCCLQHLEEFNIQDGRGTQVELDLVRFVLATAPKLRRISIKPHDKLSSGKVLKFLKNAALCKRISRDAELRYVCEDEDEDEVEDATMSPLH